MRIETERLVIRPFLESDAHAYAAIAADPDVMKHTGEGLPQSFDSSKDYVLRCIRSYETRGYARYAVCLKAENGLLIGFCGFMDDNGELEFGWRYGKPYWGRGYATEAAMAVLDYALQTPAIPRIVCLCESENIASIRVIEKLGMELVGQDTWKGKPLYRYMPAAS